MENKNNNSEKVSGANSANSAKEKRPQKNENIAEFAEFAIPSSPLMDTPRIPLEVYDLLPPILKDTASTINGGRRKDVYLISAITILSGCLPNVYGRYGSQVYYPNLYTLILAPAASGKSSMLFAEKLARHQHNQLKNERKLQMDSYNEEMTKYNQVKDKATLARPEKPVRKSLIIPGNITSASIYDLLNANEGRGIIVETEADTLSAALSQEWGAFSDLIRKTFGHERISLSRKTDNLTIEIEVPKVTILLTGTPNQMFALLSNAEDGLVSRFMYYAYAVERKWTDQKPDENSEEIDALFERKSIEVSKMIEYLNRNPVMFKLNSSQWDQVGYLFKMYMGNFKKYYGQEADGILYRLGVIMFKMCMTLTSVRNTQAQFKQDTWDCHDDDFWAAKLIIGTLIRHSLIVFENLPKKSSNNFKPMPKPMELILASMGDTFTRKDMLIVTKQKNLSARTADGFLSEKLTEQEIVRLKAGHYMKNKKDDDLTTE